MSVRSSSKLKKWKMQTPLPYITRGAGQYGTGFGGILKVFKRVAPHFKTVGTHLAGLAKSAGKSLLRTGASTSQKILGDVLAGKKIQEAAEERLQEAGNEITEKVTSKLKKMRGAGRRRKRAGGRRKRRRVTVASTTRRRGTKRRGGMTAQGGTGRKRRRVQKTKRAKSVRRHRRRDVFTA
jgi:hypothetical protein